MLTINYQSEVNMKKTNSGKCTGIKRPFKLEEIWRIRTRLELENNLMELALLNLAIDNKLRASDLLKTHVYDIASQGVINNRVQCVQQKTGTDVHYEITPRTQQSLSHRSYWVMRSWITPFVTWVLNWRMHLSYQSKQIARKLIYRLFVILEKPVPQNEL